MPRRRWRLKARREPLSAALRAYLELGLGALLAMPKAARPDGWGEAVFFTPERERATAWQEHQAELLDDWIREHPGTRPWAWWAFTAAPVPRACLEGAEYLYRGAKSRNHDGVWRAQDFGLPLRPQARRPGAEPARLLFESQAVYLQRHEQLMPGEAERLTAEDFEPEVIEIPELPELDHVKPPTPAAPALSSTNGGHRHP